MNSTYLSYLFLHHLLSLIIHREENCQISIHSIPSMALQPLLGSGLPQQPYFSVICSSRCRILLRSFQQPAVFVLLAVSYKYFLHKYVIRLNLRSSGIGRPLVRLSTIDDNPGFERRSVIPKTVFIYWSITAKVSSSPQHCITICGEVTQLLQLSDSSPPQ
jgi:hypothetical protein